MRGGALGDFVLTLPALAALRRHFPDARVGNPGFIHGPAALALAGGLADAVHSIEAPALAKWFVRDAAVTIRFEEFDLIISYVFDPENIFQSNIRRSAPKSLFLTGPHRPTRLQAGTPRSRCWSRCASLGINHADPIPKLTLPNPSPRNGWLALHPGSGSERKNWPEENWRHLLRRVMEQTEWDCLLVGGEAEGERLFRLEDSVRDLTPSGRTRLRLAKDLPLVELARLLQGCAGFVGHDSGVTHLAAAVGLPGLALWGETNQNVWRPRSHKMQMVGHEKGLSRLPVEDVFDKLTGSKSNGYVPKPNLVLQTVGGVGGVFFGPAF